MSTPEAVIASDVAGRLAGDVWRTAGPLARTPGERYLASRLGELWSDGGFPASVRWLPGSQARVLGLRPRLPTSAAGVLVYRFAAPEGEYTVAVQVEAVDTRGRRLLFGPRREAAGCGWIGVQRRSRVPGAAGWPRGRRLVGGGDVVGIEAAERAAIRDAG